VGQYMAFAPLIIVCGIVGGIIYLVRNKRHDDEPGSEAFELESIPRAIAKQLPAMVRAELKKLTSEKQLQFLEEYQRRARRTGRAYLLLIALGWHYAYFRKWGHQVLFWVTMGGVMCWWFIDFFRIPSMVRDCNKDIAVAVMKDLKVVGAS
jgi:hypothetical protein